MKELSHQEQQEKILRDAGCVVVCWHPLEIEDNCGYICTGKAAQFILDRFMTEFQEKEMGTEKSGYIDFATNMDYKDGQGSLVEKLEGSSMDQDKELSDVRAFHHKFDILNNGKTPTMLTKRKLQERIECMQEELDEFKAAVESQDFPEQADALIDLVYFAKGTAVMMGLPWEELWDDVQRANMAKVRGVGKRGHAVDMVKPEGWRKPDGALILKAHGFNRDTFSTDGVLDETKCSDDPQRKIFYLDTGDMPPEKIEAYLKAVKTRMAEIALEKSSSGITVEKVEVTAKGRKLHGEWTHEPIQDLQHLPLSDELADEISAQLTREINKTRND